MLIRPKTANVLNTGLVKDQRVGPRAIRPYLNIGNHLIPHDDGHLAAGPSGSHHSHRFPHHNLGR